MEGACEKCSSPLSPKARVCLQCGATRVPTVHFRSEQVPLPEQEAPTTIELGNDAEPPAVLAKDAEVADEPKFGALPRPVVTSNFDEAPAQASSSPQVVQRSGVPVSLVVILLVVTAMFAAIFAFAWSSDPAGGEDAQLVSVYLSGRANARDQPTAEGSSILATYDVGTQLTGTWVSGASDASEQWLKFEVDGQTRYIWGRNLSVVNSDIQSQSDVQSQNDKPIVSIDPGEAVDFVKEYVGSTNSLSGVPASDVVNTYYDDQVFYFGKNVDRSYVLGEKVRYERRWPDRTYQIMEDTVQTDCESNPMVCSVSGTMWYSATSEERGAHGEGYAEFALGVKRTTTGLRISAETSKVISN
jgi:hypothetical protein